MLTAGSIARRPFPKLELDRIPERSPISKHLPANRTDRLMRGRVISGQGEHHRFRQRPMAVAVHGDVAFEVPTQGRAGQLQHDQPIEQTAKKVGHQ